MSGTTDDKRLEIIVREAEGEDTTFFEKLYIAVRQEEFAVSGWSEHQRQMLLKMQFDAQTQGYRGQFPDLRTFVIEANGEPVGRLLLTDEIRLVDIAVLPKACNRGIGSFVLNYLLDKADSEKKDIFLQVLKTNAAARQLYERFGFEPIGGNDLYLMMRRVLPEEN